MVEIETGNNVTSRYIASDWKAVFGIMCKELFGSSDVAGDDSEVVIADRE